MHSSPLTNPMSAHVSLKWIHKSALCDINLLPYIDPPIIINHPNNDSVKKQISRNQACFGRRASGLKIGLSKIW